MKHLNRKSSPKVIGGLVQRKNNHELTPNYWNTVQKDVIIDVEKPGKGYKHFLKKRDIIKFLEIIPNWNELSEGLDAIVLCNGATDYDGVYNNDGVIEISAWEKEKDVTLSNEYFHAHSKLFDRLGVKHQKLSYGYRCEFTEEQIKAFQLLHVLLHELGHHFDRMKTKSKRNSARGEDYAETFAFKTEEKMIIDYQNKFGVVF